GEVKGELAVDVALDPAWPKGVPDTLKPRHDRTPPSRVSKYAANAFGELRPALLFESELLAALGGKGVEARVAVLLGDVPLRPHPAVPLHAMQRRVERPFLDAQQIGGDALDVRGDGVAVHPTVRIERFQHQQHERALQDVVLLYAHRGWPS